MSAQRPILIEDDEPLPPTRLALGRDSVAPGLLAIGGSVTTARLAEAYAQGIFPWFSQGEPVMWWSPDPRMVLHVPQFKVSRSLRKTLRRFAASPGCEVRVDTAFKDVISACSSVPREGQHGTWIVPEMVTAYLAWHRQGRVHSVETWIDGELAGGLYGVNLGRMFFGESMFSRRTDASKIALSALVAMCRAHGIEMIDCQQNTAHLASLGAREISRKAFEAHVRRAVEQTAPADWSYHAAHWQLLDPAILSAPPSQPAA